MSREGSVKRDRSGRWFFVVDATPAGSPKRKQVYRRGFKTKKHALDALDEAKSALRTGSFVEPSRETVAAFLRGWIDTASTRLRPSTAYSYRRNLERHVIPRIGATPLQALDASALNKMYAELLASGANLTRRADGLSARSVGYIATIVKSALSDAVKLGLIARNPAERSTPPKSTNRGKGHATWTGEQVGQFLELAEADDDSDAVLWRFLASTGVRRGEALGLRWGDVDLDEGRATIEQTVTATNHVIIMSTPKTSSGSRTIDLDSTLIRALRIHRTHQLEQRLALGAGWREHGLVFPMVDGSAMHPESASKRFDRRAARYRLPHISMHGLRHTWATLALRAGINPKVVQERLGHSSIVITLSTYSHVSAGLQREAAEQVAALFGREHPVSNRAIWRVAHPLPPADTECPGGDSNPHNGGAEL